MCELLGMSANVPTDIRFSFDGIPQEQDFPVGYFYVPEMIQPILPAVLSVRAPTGEVALQDAVAANARRVAQRLKTQSPIVGDALRQGRLKVVAARYDLDDGDVEWMEEV